jgi:hypothetical protein
MAKVICKECRHCTWLSYNGRGEPSIGCALHGGNYGGFFHHEITQCEDFRLPDFKSDCWDENGWMTTEAFKKLVGEITRGSCYIDNYRNSYGIDPDWLCWFLDGYYEWLNDDEYEGAEREDNLTNIVEWYEYYSCRISKENMIQPPVPESKGWSIIKTTYQPHNDGEEVECYMVDVYGDGSTTFRVSPLYYINNRTIIQITEFRDGEYNNDEVIDQPFNPLDNNIIINLIKINFEL